MTSPGPTPPLLLRPLTAGDERETREAHAELAGDGFDFLLDERSGEPWLAYVERLELMRHGSGLAAGQVPATFLVAEVGGRLVGRVSVRHELNAWLAAVGGHIGFCVRPGLRRRGYATEILRQALLIARTAGVTGALVICDEENAASAATIEACGGRLEPRVGGEDGQAPRRRYSITTTVMGDQRICEFGFPGALRDRLVEAVLDGSKTATSSLLAEWEADGDAPPVPGERETVVDSTGRPVATIETVAVDVIRLADADDRLALAEGESYATAAGWRAEHERFWREEVLPAWPAPHDPPRIDDDTRVLVQWFRLAGSAQPPTAPAARAPGA